MTEKVKLTVPETAEEVEFYKVRMKTLDEEIERLKKSEQKKD